MSLSNWHTVTLGEICDVYDGPHATPKKVEHGPVFLGISCLSNGRLDLSEAEHLSEEDYITWTRRIAPKTGDVVFSYETRIGEVAQIPDGLKCCLGRRMGLLRPNLSKVDPRFLLYAYLGPNFQNTLRARTVHGSTVNRIPIKELPSYPIEIPPLPIQKRIAEILGRLDDKIEVNRRINRMLETMAQALYKHWFVDFGPFQDSPFVDSELGPIPEGWRVGNLGNLAKIEKDTVEPQTLSPSTPYIGLADMPKGSIALDAWGEAKDSTSTKFRMQTGQILFGKLRPYFKKVGIAPVDGVCSTDIYVVIPRKPEFYGFVLTQLIQQEFIDYTESVSDGTRMPRVNWAMMAKYPLALPEPALLKKFGDIMKPWAKIIVKNVEENRQLASIRDYLLPKLLSGEVPVAVIEQRAEEVAR